MAGAPGRHNNQPHTHHKMKAHRGTKRDRKHRHAMVTVAEVINSRTGVRAYNVRRDGRAVSPFDWSRGAVRGRR